MILTDYHLEKDKTGADAIRKVRETAKRCIPAIMLTGDTSSMISERVRDIQECLLIKKPVGSDEFIAILNRLIRE